MKVVCVEKNRSYGNVPDLVKGNIYHVIDESYINGITTKGVKCEKGTYYKLIETGTWYIDYLFIKINDTEIDELECIKVEEIKN